MSTAILETTAPTQRHLLDEASVRAFVDGTASWKHLEDEGFDYVDVIHAIGAYGLGRQAAITPKDEPAMKILRACCINGQATISSI